MFCMEMLRQSPGGDYRQVVCTMTAVTWYGSQLLLGLLSSR